MTTITSNWTTLDAGGIRWEMAGELRQVLLDADGLRLPQWIRQGQAQIIKQGPHRLVYRVDLPEISFYLKHNLVPDHVTWFRQLLRRSKARREYDAAIAVGQRSIPTIVPLAVGEESRLTGGQNFLITRTIEDSEPLNLFLARTLPALPLARQARVRNRLARTLGELLANLHEAGVQHHDLHAANLLVRLHDDDRVEWSVIDLNAVQVGPKLNWAQSRRNLVIFNSWFMIRANRSDRMRFWHAYFAKRRLREWVQGSAHLLNEVEQATWRYNLAFWRFRDRRCLKNNRYYRRVSAPGMVGHVRTELDAASVAQLLSDPDRLLDAPSVTIWKQSPSSTVAEVTLHVQGQPRQVVFKKYQVTQWSDPLAALVRPAPALRSWVRGQGFIERGLPTAKPLAVLHRVKMGLLQEGYLITEKIEHAQELGHYVASLSSLPEAQRLRHLRVQIERIARVIRAMHKRHVSHRDLKAANVLVHRVDAPPIATPAESVANLLSMPPGHVWLIDLVGVDVYCRLPRRRKAQNLTRLNASFPDSTWITRTDRLRFLRVYLEWGLHGKGKWKQWWRLIARLTQKKIARNQRVGRPLE